MQAEYISPIRSTWERLIRPSAHLTGEEYRQARLMLAILTVLLALVYTGGIVAIYNEYFIQNEPYLGVVVLASSAAFILTLVYILGKTERYHVARIMFVATPILVIVIMTIVSPPSARNTFFLYYSLLTPLLGSILLNGKETFIASVATFVIDLILIQISDIDKSGVFDEMMFIGILPSLLVVSAFMRQQYIEQIRQQIIDLEQAEREARLAKEEAERSNHVKSAFLASMSHELRTPLNSVLNFSKFVARGVMGPVNEKQQDALNKVINSGKHLLNLINDVLDMSKIESGSLTLFVEDNIDVRQMMDTAISTAESLLHERDAVQLKTEIPDSLPILTGDRKRMLQVVLNVVSNACKFTEKGSVTLSANLTASAIRITVTDTGMGIAPEDHAAVFKPFQQTESGLRQGGGTGLGMPISKSLVEAHGGRLWFESEAGKGTTFYIEFPLKSSLVVTA